MDHTFLHTQKRIGSKDKEVKGKNTALFTVDLEDWFHALDTYQNWWKYEDRIEEPTYFLLDILEKYGVKGHWYVLGDIVQKHPDLIHAIAAKGHTFGSHGWFHRHNEKESDIENLFTIDELKRLGYEAKDFRSPYWDWTPWPGHCGGFSFRSLPLWFILREVKRTGLFYVHPHDVMLHHPKVDNWVLNLKRQWGLKDSRKKLDRLLQEVEWIQSI